MRKRTVLHRPLMRRSFPGIAPKPSAPIGVETTGTRFANPSMIFRRVPLPNRSGTTIASAFASSRRMSGTYPVTVTFGWASSLATVSSHLPTILNWTRILGQDLRQDLIDEVLRTVGVGLVGHLTLK